ncbi:hypothetical protein SCLCIDRAFT_80083, partial [Scleroderma citrinum Foug A]
LKELIITAWKQYFSILKQDLVEVVGQISFTADIWSNSLCCPYIGMTAHWIKWKADGCLSLEAALIAFH